MATLFPDNSSRSMNPKDAPFQLKYRHGNITSIYPTYIQTEAEGLDDGPMILQELRAKVEGLKYVELVRANGEQIAQWDA